MNTKVIIQKYKELVCKMKLLLTHEISIQEDENTDKPFQYLITKKCPVCISIATSCIKLEKELSLSQDKTPIEQIREAFEPIQMGATMVREGDADDKVILSLFTLKRFLRTDVDLGFCKEKYYDRLAWYLDAYFKDASQHKGKKK